MSSESTPDRRVRKSREALVRALIQLMVEKGYEETNISDIAQRANVGRSTFYAHYADKEDLLQDCVAGLRAHLEASAASATLTDSVHPALAFALPMLRHVQQAEKLFLSSGTRSGAPVRRCIHEMLVDVVLGPLGPIANELPVPAPLIAELVAGGFISICIWWTSSAPHLTPDEVNEAFCRLVTPGLVNHR